MLKYILRAIRIGHIAYLMFKRNFVFDYKEDIYIIKLMEKGIGLDLNDREICNAIINKHRVYP